MLIFAAKNTSFIDESPLFEDVSRFDLLGVGPVSDSFGCHGPGEG
jgi:hypothetical protein